MSVRLKEKYNKVIVPELKTRWKLKNVLQVPRITKIVINIGLSEAKENIKVLEVAQEELAAITGQRPMVRRAKKSISNFKLRENMPIGLKVTLRGEKMYEFFDRLISIAIPRMRDFRGLNRLNFDGRGSYNLGLNEQYIFPEINLEKSDKMRGMNISIVTNAGNDEKGIELLSLFGMPFRKKS